MAVPCGRPGRRCEDDRNQREAVPTVQVARRYCCVIAASLLRTYSARAATLRPNETGALVPAWYLDAGVVLDAAAGDDVGHGSDRLQTREQPACQGMNPRKGPRQGLCSGRASDHLVIATRRCRQRSCRGVGTGVDDSVDEKAQTEAVHNATQRVRQR
jgi:hypothetical protein